MCCVCEGATSMEERISRGISRGDGRERGEKKKEKGKEDEEERVRDKNCFSHGGNKVFFPYTFILVGNWNWRW